MVDAPQRVASDPADGRLRLALVLVMVVGILIRLGYIALFGVPANGAEAGNVAAALATGRGFADAYFPGSGPTAHFTPSMLLIAAGVMALFGVDTLASGVILETIVLLMVFGSIWLLALTMLRLKVPRLSVLGGAALLSLVPLYMQYEIYYFRYWEAALAVFLQALVLFALARSDVAAQRRWLLVVLAVVPVVLFMVLPPLGIAAVAMTAVTLVVQRQWRLMVKVAVGAAATGVVLFGPWVLRNTEVMGRPILLRSNAGLELTLSVGTMREQSGIAGDLYSNVHPYHDGPGRRAYIAEGELPYYDRLLSEAVAVVAADPWRFAALMATHVRQMIVPDLSQFSIVDGFNPLRRAVLYAGVALSGIVGFTYGAFRIDRRLALPLVQVAVVIACYAPFQPTSRYIYVNYVPLAFGCALCAGWLLQAAAQSLRRRGSSVASAR